MPFSTAAVHSHTATVHYAAWGAGAGRPGSSRNDRRVNFFALNNIFIPDNTTMVAVRYGYNRFVDNGNFFPAFDAGSLGLPASYVNAMAFDTLPRVTVNGYGNTYLASNVVSVGYMGSRSERMSIGGTTDAMVNINQLDPQYLSLGRRCSNR
jgi:hypothetical protein